MYERSLDPSVSVFSLSLYRHPSICILFISLFTSYNKQHTSDHPGMSSPGCPKSMWWKKKVELYDPVTDGKNRSLLDPEKSRGGQKKCSLEVIRPKNQCIFHGSSKSSKRNQSTTILRIFTSVHEYLRLNVYRVLQVLMWSKGEVYMFQTWKCTSSSYHLSFRRKIIMCNN